MKLILINLLLLLLLGLSSCGPMSYTPDVNLEDSVLTDVLLDATKGITAGIDRNIPIKKLSDDEENPIMDYFEAIEFYPLRSVSEDKFEYFFFNLYCEVECDVYIHVSIEDEVIEYDWIEERIEDPETGEITIVKNKIEVNRYKEVLDLSDGGESAHLNSNEGKAYIYSMNYVIKSYSSSTCFKLFLTDSEGNLLPYKWGIDELQILTSKIEENN